MTDDLKPYLAYKDSGVPWLGKVPEHWNIERAKWLFQKMDRPVQDSDEVVTCFRDGMVTLRKNRRMRGFTESIKEIGYQGIRRGDLVIHVMDAFAGAIGVSDSDGKGSPVYSVCNPILGVDAYYYAYVTREMARNQWIQALAKGIRERSTDFRYNIFGSQSVPRPPSAEQAAIVRYLDYMDRRIRRYIRAKQKLIKLLEEQKQSIIHQAVTGQIDVRTGQPYPAYKPSGVEWLGEVPEHWEVRKIKTLFTEVNYRSTDGSEVLLSLRMYEGLIPHVEVSDRPISSEALVGYKKISPGQMVMNRMRAAIGIFGVASAPGIVSPDYAIFEPKNGANPEYFLKLFKTPQLCSEFMIESKGLGTGSSGFMRLYTDKFGGIYVPVPPLDEQSAILDKIAADSANLERTLATTRTEISLLKEYQSRLIADVVTGKLDVRQAAAGLSEEVEEPELLEDEADIDSDDATEDDLEEEIEEEAA